MTPTTQSAGTSTSGNSPEENYRIVRRRNRVPLSCLPCRTRKLKCNRGTPSCDNCVKRRDAQSCTYATPTSRKRNPANAEATPTTDDMQNRMDRLEHLLLGLVKSGGSIEASPESAAAAAAAAAATTAASGAHKPSVSTQDEADVDSSDVDDGLATSLGVLKVDSDRGKSMYIGQEHWHTLLSDIAEVKNFYSSHKKEMEKSYQQITSSKPAQSRDSPIFLLSAPPATEAELRAELPSRTAITTLISRYFNSLDTSVSILHDPTFHKELQAHWQDPAKSSVMWIGLVYSMLCLAMLSYHKVGDEPAEWKGRSLELAAEYRLRTVQCLVVADYTKPVDYTVETMIHYLLGEWSSRWDAEVGCWLIISQIVRVAFRMGYHRDAEWFPSISPFQGEMRRRAWALVRMADIMFSYQVSLPSMINDHMTDTKLPHNLFDEEFGPDSVVLPAPRPITEPTHVAYMIIKTRLQFAFSNIIQAVTRVGKPPTYEEIISHDQKLRDIHNEFPPHLKMQPVESPNDPVKLIIARFNLNLLYQKIVCALHRKHSQRARQNPRYAHSRRSVMEASLETLRNLITIREECMPTGRLRNMQWFFQSTIKDTLLPTMLVVLDLHHDNRAVASGVRQNSQSMYFWTPDQRVEMVALLNSVKDIWKSLKGTSMEAYKASNILEIMLDKIQEPVPATGAADVLNPEDLFGNFGTNDMQPEHSAAMTLEMMSTGMTPNYQSQGGTAYPPLNMVPMSGLTPEFSGDFFGGINTTASPFSLLDNDMTLDQNFDWASFENYTQNASWGPDQTTFGLFGSPNDEQSQAGSSSTGSYPFMATDTPSTGKSA